MRPHVIHRAGLIFADSPELDLFFCLLLGQFIGHSLVQSDSLSVAAIVAESILKEAVVFLHEESADRLCAQILHESHLVLIKPHLREASLVFLFLPIRHVDLTELAFLKHLAPEHLLPDIARFLERALPLGLKVLGHFHADWVLYNRPDTFLVLCRRDHAAAFDDASI